MKQIREQFVEEYVVEKFTPPTKKPPRGPRADGRWVMVDEVDGFPIFEDSDNLPYSDEETMTWYFVLRTVDAEGENWFDIHIQIDDAREFSDDYRGKPTFSILDVWDTVTQKKLSERERSEDDNDKSLRNAVIDNLFGYVMEQANKYRGY